MPILLPIQDESSSGSTLTQLYAGHALLVGAVLVVLLVNTLRSRLKPIRRKVEGLVGLPLLDLAGRIDMKHSKLVGPKQVYLPQQGIFLNYYERRPKDTSVGNPDNARPAPTLLLCHGIGTSAAEFCALLKNLRVPDHVRILVPEHIGHGADLARARTAARTGSGFAYPTPNDLLESTTEFVDLLVPDGAPCHALGTSLGGALLYFLRVRRPDLIQKTVLVAPAIPSVLQTPFVRGLADGSNPFLEFGSRDDAKRLMRDYLWTDPVQRQQRRESSGNKKLPKDPIPKIFYGAMYRASLRDVPRGHFRKVQDTLLDVAYGLHGEGNDTAAEPQATTDETEPTDNLFRASSDLDPECDRLLVWPEEDQIADLAKGKVFFQAALASGRTRLETVPACGHMFAADRTLLYDLIAPTVRDFLLDDFAGE